MENSMNDELLKTNQSEVTCKQCGAKLVYAPGTTSLKCEYCGAENEIHVEPTIIEEMDLKNLFQNIAIRCPSIRFLRYDATHVGLKQPLKQCGVGTLSVLR
jgi:LSD1 subclass zinc finger protein